MREELLKKFAEDDRLEQLNEHKRRLKVGKTWEDMGRHGIIAEPPDGGNRLSSTNGRRIASWSCDVKCDPMGLRVERSMHP